MHLDIRASLKQPEGNFAEIAEDIKEKTQRDFDIVPWVDGTKVIITYDDIGHEHSLKIAFTGSCSDYREEVFMCQIIDKEGRCRYTKSIYYRK